MLLEDLFHGTTHNFDRFDIAHIGVGEGNQIYGWGLYFASEKEVAVFYRDSVAKSKNNESQLLVDGKPYTYDPHFGERDDITADQYAVWAYISVLLKEKFSSPQECERMTWEIVSNIILNNDYEDNPFWNEVNSIIVSRTLSKRVSRENPHVGKIYKVEIPDNYEFLNWHSAQQSTFVNECLSYKISTKKDYQNFNFYIEINNLPAIKFAQIEKHSRLFHVKFEMQKNKAMYGFQMSGDMETFDQAKNFIMENIKGFVFRGRGLPLIIKVTIMLFLITILSVELKRKLADALI